MRDIYTPDFWNKFIYVEDEKHAIKVRDYFYKLSESRIVLDWPPVPGYYFGWLGSNWGGWWKSDIEGREIIELPPDIEDGYSVFKPS